MKIKQRGDTKKEAIILRTTTIAIVKLEDR